MIEFVTEDALKIWTEGGWLMGPLFILGLLIYYSIFEIYFRLSSKSYIKTDSNIWRHWVEKPADAEGDIGRIINFVLADKKTTKDVSLRFQEVRHTLVESVGRRIKFVAIIVSAAPLTGLLGTVPCGFKTKRQFTILRKHVKTTRNFYLKCRLCAVSLQHQTVQTMGKHM